jgi:hypothetical protein
MVQRAGGFLTHIFSLKGWHDMILDFTSHPEAVSALKGHHTKEERFNRARILATLAKEAGATHVLTNGIPYGMMVPLEKEAAALGMGKGLIPAHFETGSRIAVFVPLRDGGTSFEAFT